MAGIVRRMELRDLKAVVELDQLSFALPWPERSFLYELTGNQASRVWVAEVDGRLAAMTVIWVIVDEAHVGTFAVHPDFRRRGIGRKLLAQALLAALDEGVLQSYLEVRRGNVAARALYEKFGYVESGIRPRYYRDNNEDALLMTLHQLDREALQRFLSADPE